MPTVYKYFFIVFECGRILERTVDKQNVKCNALSRPNYFSVNVYVLGALFLQKFSKNFQFWLKLEETIRTWFRTFIPFLLIKCSFQNSIPFKKKKKKKKKKLLVSGKNYFCRLSNIFIQQRYSLKTHIF